MIKAVVLMLLGRAFKLPWRRSVRLGLLLSQAGEFGFVLFAQAAAGQLLTAESAAMFSAVVVLSMATTPFLMRLTDVLDRYEEKSDRSRRAGKVARNAGHRRRLRALRPDRRRRC